MLNRTSSAGIAALLTLASCSADNNGGRRGGPHASGIVDGTGTAEGGGTSTPASPDGTTTPGDDAGPDDGSGPSTVFDIGDGSIFCQDKTAGIHCDDTTVVLCDGNGGTEDTTECLPEACLDGLGCVACQAGEWTCKGPRVMSCNTDGNPFWEEVAVCDPAQQQYCDVTVGGCSPLTPLGGIEPTGEYYQYSSFVPEGFSVVCDVDAIDNRIWFVAYNAADVLSITAYDVELQDTDGDGMLEPNQHPDDPDHTGPVEERVFTFVQTFTIDNPGAVPHTMELHATPTTIFYSGATQIGAYDLATGTTSMEAPAPAWVGALSFPYLAFLGHDDLNDVWYSGNEAARRVFQYDRQTMTWGYAFEYPVLAGDHMDGIEVVTDPSTGTPYVYVSDMTSNFIGQYRHDSAMGWVQENLFSYSEANGEVVEGFGFGALNHFWVGSYTQNSVYEIGGGDLTQFLDPEG